MKKYFFLLLILILPFCINATELSDIFGNYPKENHYKTQKMKKDSFFISCDTITGRWGKETISLLKEYAPNFYVAYASRNNFTDHREILSLLKENNIGFFAYDWGIETNFCNYLRERDGLDYTWAGLNMNTDVTDPCSHCQSTSAKATKEIWKTYLESTINMGGMGVIHCDLISPSFYGRGVCGHNPEALSAYVSDLKGTDKGILVNIKGSKKTYHFPDYVKFYLGYFPKPQDFGFDSWDQYKPILKKDYDKEGYEKYIIDKTKSRSFYFNIEESTKRDYVNSFLLHDMLCHYEMLKFCDAQGAYAKKIGGEYIALPNPEDMSNGIDDYFLSSLVNLGGETSEYFQSPSFLNRSYSLNNYMKENSHKAGQKVGAVLEVGPGGNDLPYYDHRIAYLTAYELRAACDLDYLQADHFLRSFEGFDINKVLEDPVLKGRCLGFLSYANGYKYAIEDNYKKLESDFTSVISRRIFRPWGRDYRTYSFFFDDPNGDFLPENIYFREGYLFNTVGFENAPYLKGKLVSWVVNKSPVAQFDTFLKKVYIGDIENAILINEALESLCDYDMNIVPTEKYYPFLKTKLITKKNEIMSKMSTWEETLSFGPRNTENNLKSKVKVVLEGKEYTIYGNIYHIDGDSVLQYRAVPVLKKIKYGKGTIYALTFNPAIKENKEISAFVVNYIMKNIGIKPISSSIRDSSVTVYKNNKSYMVRIMNKKIDADLWGDFYKNPHPLDKHCVYDMDEKTEGWIYLKPNKVYYVYDILGDKKTLKTDNLGALKLITDKSMAIFIIKEQEDILFLEKELKARKDILNNLLTLSP